MPLEQNDVKLFLSVLIFTLKTDGFTYHFFEFRNSGGLIIKNFVYNAGGCHHQQATGFKLATGTQNLSEYLKANRFDAF